VASGLENYNILQVRSLPPLRFPRKYHSYYIQNNGKIAHQVGLVLAYCCPRSRIMTNESKGRSSCPFPCHPQTRAIR
jgi:hypothetical protein